MKKILLSFAALACALFSDAQLILNELYVRPNPNPGHHEYIELKNTTGIPENADCYSIVTYFEAGQGQVGFYVIDVPAITVGANGFLVTSSVAPTFQYQNGAGNADFSWNDGNINRYVRQNGNLVLNNTGAPYANILVKSNGAANGQSGIYAVFLFKNGTLVDAFLGNHNNITVPGYITSLGTLAANTGCATLAYDFGNINNEPDALFGQVNAEAGTDNGYHRVGGGCESNGMWQKASSIHEHTPGMPNPGNGRGNNNITPLQADAQCMDATTVSYNITAGSNGAFPVTVSLYWDANGSQFIDSGDVFIGAQVDGSVNDPAKTFTHPAGQEDFIFVFDAKGSCYDTVMPLNCPASIILPVSIRTFTAKREGNVVRLQWETVTEINNRGFNVQRMQGNGRWETLGFVASQASRGNSNAELHYSFTDGNIATGVTQYRLQQIDLDGRTHYSDIRTVRNDKQAGKNIVFPNPSSGAANITFGNIGGRHDVQVTDMSGRVVKQFNGVTDNSLQLTNLTPGMYMIRVVDQTGGTQTTERLVVSGR